MKIPPFARTRMFFGLLVMAFISIYRPRRSYELLADAYNGSEFRDYKSKVIKSSEKPFLNVYGQESWKDDVVIVGNKATLVNLREMLDLAIKDGSSQRKFHVSDAEPFECLITTTSEHERLTVPYYGDDASEGRLNCIKPSIEMS